MLVAAAAAADGGTWTDSAFRQSGCIITRQQHHPHRLSDAKHENSGSNQCRHRPSHERWSTCRLQFQVFGDCFLFSRLLHVIIFDAVAFLTNLRQRSVFTAKAP